MHSDLLLELGTEDLPARYLMPLVDALADGICDGLKKRGLSAEAVQRYATPRRLAVCLRGLAYAQPDQVIDRKGPSLAAAYRDGQPTPAALGFAKSCGVALDELSRDDGYLSFRRMQPGRPTVQLIPEVFAEALKKMDELVPKRMRWGDGDQTFVRPVQWLLCLFGDEQVPLQALGLTAGRVTYGHRFHAPAALALEQAGDYEAALKRAKVWADVASRRAEIETQVKAQAAVIGGVARITEELLDEVTALVEWPVVIFGRIEERFLLLPPEVIVSTVETNQRYFTVFGQTPSLDGQMRSDSGYLLPAFITVANIESKRPAEIVAGNERVVRPRLSDALFFWEQDRRAPLEAYAAQLETVLFQKALGSVAEKSARIGVLAGRIAELLGADAAPAQRAAALCKCDLVTKMVFEFPELQGLMGGYYARAGGEPEAVAQAIAEHYRPTQAGAPIPATLPGRIVALADKLDTLAGIFAIGQKPTASKDPYALRRAALGVLRILIEGELDLDLRVLLHEALQAQRAGKRDDDTLEALWGFCVERLRGVAMERGASAEAVEAVRGTEVTRPLDFIRRLDALCAFQQSNAAVTLAAADKRARNILRQADAVSATEVSAALFEHDAERALFAALQTVQADAAPLRRQQDYQAMLDRLATLKEPVDAFFDAVMVMAEDPALRANRIALLAQLDAACREVADLSCLPS